MQSYIQSSGCRQSHIEAYFGFNANDSCGICDYCKYQGDSKNLDLAESISESIRLKINTLDAIVESIGFKYKLEIIKEIQKLLEEDKIIYKDKKFYLKSA